MTTCSFGGSLHVVAVFQFSNNIIDQNLFVLYHKSTCTASLFKLIISKNQSTHVNAKKFFILCKNLYYRITVQ